MVVAVLGGIAVWRAVAPEPMATGGAEETQGAAGRPGDRGGGRQDRGSEVGRGAGVEQESAADREERARKEAAPPGEAVPPEEPMIHMPAPPPPEEGAGDDFKESGVTRPLFDAKVALEGLMPSPARVDGAAKKLGKPLDEAARAKLKAAFDKHDEEAAQALASFRLKELSEEQAKRAVQAAEERYLKAAAEVFGSPAAEVKKALEEALPR